MDTATLDSHKTALQARREEVRTELDRLDTEMQQLGVAQAEESGGLGNHMADDGTNVLEQERAMAIGNDLRGLLGQVDGALERIEEGTYGTCQRCGKPINPERLEAFPYVPHCIDCQNAIEHEQQLRAGG